MGNLFKDRVAKWFEENLEVELTPKRLERQVWQIIIKTRRKEGSKNLKPYKRSKFPDSP